MKYEEWLVSWLKNYIQPSSKQRTYMRYSEIVNQHIVPKLGQFDMNELTPLTLQGFVTELLDSGNLKTLNGLSSNSVNAIITVIQNSLKTAYTLNYIGDYTADKIKRPRTDEKKIECFSFAEQKKMERYIMNTKKSRLFGILLCLYTGLRIGELLALKWLDVDFARSEIRIDKTCYDGKNSEGVFTRITNLPKTCSSIRTIPVPKQFMPMLRDAKRQSHSIYIVSNGEKPVPLRSYQRTFTTLQNKLDIPHRGFHSLRHTFATRALECGMDVKTLSEILGHKSPTVTLNRYVHSLMEHKKEMMNKLGKLL